MKPSERFLTTLRSFTDDRTMEHLAIRLDHVLSAADAGVLRLGIWDDGHDLVSADGEAIMDAHDLLSVFSRCLRTRIDDVVPVRLNELNTPVPRLPWMTKEATEMHHLLTVDTVALMLVRSIEEPFIKLIETAWWERIPGASVHIRDAIAPLREVIWKSAEVRCTSNGTIALPGIGAGNLALLIAANLTALVASFAAAITTDNREAVLSLGPVVDLLDTGIPLGTKADNDTTVLLLVE